jgi:hypothetical protein
MNEGAKKTVLFGIVSSRIGNKSKGMDKNSKKGY